METPCRVQNVSRVTTNSTVCSLLDVIAAVLVVHLFSLGLAAVTDEFDEFLLCRRCGHDVTRYNNLVNIPSTLAHRQRNDTIHGNTKVLIQLFKNPQGAVFEVITSAEADIAKVDKAVNQDSWFPGFSWTIAVCPRCGQHLGWVFTSVGGMLEGQPRNSFVGLILEKLLHQNYADSLLVVPKSYKS